MIRFENIQIQLVDLPAITAPNVNSWLPNIVRNADLLLMVVDLTHDPIAQVEALSEWLAKFRMTVSDSSELAEDAATRKKVLIVGNKMDQEGAAEGYRILSSRHDGKFPVISISAKEGKGLDQLGERIFKALEVIRVYTKAPGQKPDLTDPVVLKKGSTALDAAESVHKDFGRNLKYARVWGSGKFDGQEVKREYVLQDGDVIELHI
jgi:ribosome-interacting GTPase 1